MHRLNRAVVVCLPVVLLACPSDPPIVDPETGGGDEAPVDPTTGAPAATMGTTEGATTEAGTDTGETTAAASSSGEDDTGPTPPPVCGNGFVEGDEPCDDANDDPDDGCNKACERTGVPIWTLSWDSGVKQDDNASAVALGADGSIHVAGTIENADNYADAVVRKLDPEGNELARFVYAGQLGLDDGGSAIALTNEGGVILAGYETLIDEGPWQAFVRKFSAAGEVAWTYTQAAPYADGSSSALAVVDRGDAVFVLGAEEVEEDVYETYLHRLDPDDGQPVWTIALTESTGYQRKGLTIEPGGDVVLTAAQSTGMNGAPVPFVARHAAADGAEVWTRTFDDQIGYGFGVAVAGDGSIAVTGIVFHPLSGDADIWVARLADDGAPVWTDAVDRDKGYDQGSAVAWSPDGGVYVGGYVFDGAQQSNAWVRRYDGDGAAHWTSLYNDAADLYDSVTGLAVGEMRVVVVGNEDVIGHGSNQWIRAYEP